MIIKAHKKSIDDYFKQSSFILWCLILSACSTEVKVSHSPIIVRDTDQITFEATAEFSLQPESFEIEILIDSSVVATCTSSPCSFTGGPFPNQSGNVLSYSTNVVANYLILGFSDTQNASDGEYYTGITEADFTWNGRDYIPARVADSLSSPTSNIYFKEDLVLHMAEDYNENLSLFFSHVENKIYNVIGNQDLLDESLEKFNFWVYTREARRATGCGQPHRRADNDMPWADTNGVLHIDNIRDCTNVGLDRFSAEGSNTRAFLHELGHAIFGLGDEYDGDTNYSIVESPEPNIFPTQSECSSEQLSKGRPSSDCFMFTAEDGDWWGIHTGTTVMTNGLSGEPWGVEAVERVELFLSTIP